MPRTDITSPYKNTDRQIPIPNLMKIVNIIFILATLFFVFFAIEQQKLAYFLNKTQIQ